MGEVPSTDFGPRHTYRWIRKPSRHALLEHGPGYPQEHTDCRACCLGIPDDLYERSEPCAIRRSERLLRYFEFRHQQPGDLRFEPRAATNHLSTSDGVWSASQ